MSIFDQSYVTTNKHFLEIDQSQYPEEHRIIIRKLLEAYASKDVRENMHLEDEYFDELIRKEKLIARQKEKLAQKDEIIAAKDAELAQKATQTALKLKQKGMSDEDISEITGLSLQQINNLT